MKIITVMLLLLFPGCLLAQDAIPIKNGQRYNPEQIAWFLQPLYKENDFVISYRVRQTDKIDEKSDYFILTRSGVDMLAYNYLQKDQQLKAIKLSKQSLELIWNTFVQNELFSIKNEKDIPNFCLEKYQIYNSHTYEFVLFTKGTMKTLTYYDPEYYDNACYGMSERRKIINSASVINYVLSN